MQLASAFLVSFMLMDYLHPTISAPFPQSDTTYAVAGNGSLAVTVEETQTVGSVPKSATRIPFLTLNLSASCDKDIKVESIEIRHLGLGRVTDIAGLYAVTGFQRVTRSAHFDSNRISTSLRFHPLIIPKCGGVELRILGDIAASAETAGEHGIALIDADPVHSTAKQTTVTVGDSTERILTVPENGGMLTARFLPVAKSLRYGRTETVARLQLTADSKTAHLLKKIMFTNQADARDMDLQWLKLETLSGSVLTPATPRMKGFTATLEFNPTYILHAGETLVLKLTAEIHASQSKKINLHLEQPSDLFATPYHER